MADPGSTALRERLANERTLLAWIRTAITLMGFGLVVARFGVLARLAGATGGEATEARVVGIVLVLFGSALALLGAQRMAAYGRLIEAGGGRPRDRPLLVSAVAVAVLGGALALQIGLSS